MRYNGVLHIVVLSFIQSFATLEYLQSVFLSIRGDLGREDIIIRTDWDDTGVGTTLMRSCSRWNERSSDYM